ncbi:MAG: hypothetical protein CO056_00405 [Candidatus Tagabacteria bacterium CG_4_9_14_0_2_um_filter_41_11]|uniref:DUF4015 domain-containing protein n=1 Tax=Candidatus Tagabacteria bacterium CG_4_9_14_0_2_um_filter_41_11 TaxID=1975019 RepID=A0A2M8ERS4_9BACT|nr:MAG: hypothetical protein CO056_00405 [Candidatus Tagabacteria bacterium CG_4_9_14_0_2_um_filter_41_11]
MFKIVLGAEINKPKTIVLCFDATLKNGLKFLDGKKVIIRPWIQNFSIASIYGCGPTVYYGYDNVHAQIQACRDLGINGFMLWNANNNFTIEVLK